MNSIAVCLLITAAFLSLILLKMSDIEVHSGSCEEQDIAANVAMLRQMELAEPSVKPRCGRSQSRAWTATATL